MKKLIMLLVSVMMVFSLAACGGGDSAGGDTEVEKEPEVVTVEKYKALQEDKWGDMTREEMTEYLGVEGVTDEEGVERWGEGFDVVDFPGPDEDSYLHVLFELEDDGRMEACSMSPTGVLAED